jgi:hypothetical protein
MLGVINMSEEFILSENTINIPNPRKIQGQGEVIIGIFLSLIGLIVLFIWNYAKYLNFQSIRNPGFLEALLAGICLIVGITHVIQGLKNMFVWVIPAHAPRSFGDLDILFTTLRTSDIHTYQKPDSLSFKILHGIFSDKVFYFTSLPRDISLDNISFIMQSVIFSAILLFFWKYVSLFVTMGFITLLLISSVLCIVLTAMIVPKHVPTAKRVYTPQDINGGHPQKVYRSLEDGAIELKFDFPYRFLGSVPSLINSGVQNTGTSHGYTLMETQPETVETRYWKAAIFSLVCGGFFIVLGYFLSVTMNSMIYTKGMPLPIAGAILVGIGYKFLGKSTKLFNLMRFKSKIILSDIKGEYYRSDLGVGKGMHESLSSQRIAVISDNRLSHYAADVLSECHTLNGMREIIAINNSEEIDNDVKSLIKFVESQRKPDLEVQGIDFGQESASKLLQQNVAIARIKAQALGKLPRSAPGMKEISRINHLELEGKDDEADMLCSHCGTGNKGAKFCMNCGAKL